MNINQSHILSSINKYLLSKGRTQLNSVSKGCAVVWACFSMVNEEQEYWKHLQKLDKWNCKTLITNHAIEDFVNAIIALQYDNCYNSGLLNNKPINNFSEIKGLEFHWCCSKQKAISFFTILLEYEGDQDWSSNKKMLLIKTPEYTNTPEYVCAIIPRNEGSFLVYVPSLAKSILVFSVSELIDIIFDSMVIIREHDGLTTLIIHIYSGSCNDVVALRKINLDLDVILKAFYYQKFMQLKNNEKKYFETNNYKTWLYYTPTIVKSENFWCWLENDMPMSIFKQLKPIKSKLLLMLKKEWLYFLQKRISSYLFYNILEIATPLELSIRYDNISDLKTNINKFRENINNISKYYEATPLMQAAFLNKSNSVKLLLEHKASINVKNYASLNALDYAIAGRHLDICRMLIKSGAKPSKLIFSDFSPKDNMNIKLCKFLLEVGLDPNFRVKGNTLLHIILKENSVTNIGCNDFKLCKLLLRFGANVNATNDNGETPLSLAIATNNLKIIELLLKSGAKTRPKDDLFGWLICKGLDLELFELLLKYKLIQKLPDGYPNDSVFHYAVNSGKLDLCRLCIKYKIFVELQNNRGETPLHYAVKNQSYSICEFLLVHGSSPNLQTDCGLTPLHVAAELGELEITNLLLKHGANVNSVDYQGITPLHLAAYFGYLETCQLLIEHGANVNAMDKYNCTPLLGAYYYGYVEICQLLIEHGANYSIIKNQFVPPNLTLFSHAVYLYKSSTELLFARSYDLDNNGLLINYFKYLYTPEEIYFEAMKKVKKPNDIESKIKLLTDAAACGREDVCKYLLGQKIIDINSIKGCYYSPLLEAIIYGREMIVKLLLDYNVGYKDNLINSTPIYIAMIHNRGKICKLLHGQLNGNHLFEAIKNGNESICKTILLLTPNVNYVNIINENPLQEAVREQNEAICRILLENGADPNLIMNRELPLYTAIKNNNQGIIKMLLAYKADVNQLDHNGDPMLHLAITAFNYKKQIVKFLLELGADPNAKNQCGDPSIVRAMSEKHSFETINLLLKYGANPNLKGQFNNLPIIAAIRYKLGDVCKMLLQYGAILNFSDLEVKFILEFFIRHNDIDFFKILLYQHQKNTVINFDVNKCLMLAKKNNANDICKLLIKHE